MVLRILEVKVLHKVVTPYISLALIKSNLKYKEDSPQCFSLKYSVTLAVSCFYRSLFI